MKKMLLLIVTLVVAWCLVSRVGVTLNGKKVDVWFPLKFGFSKQNGLTIDVVPPPPELKK